MIKFRVWKSLVVHNPLWSLPVFFAYSSLALNCLICLFIPLWVFQFFIYSTWFYALTTHQLFEVAFLYSQFQNRWHILCPNYIFILSYPWPLLLLVISRILSFIHLMLFGCNLIRKFLSTFYLDLLSISVYLINVLILSLTWTADFRLFKNITARCGSTDYHPQIVILVFPVILFIQHHVRQ